MSKKPAAKGGKEDPGFRQRRLSVSDIDTSEFEKASSSSPAAGGRRQRRMSMSPEMGVVKPRALLPFPPEIVGTYSCHGVEPGMMAGQTSAKINQDRGCVCHPFGPDDSYKMALFCVFDGHGAQGDKVSHYAMNNIQGQLEDHPKLYSDPGLALKEVFLKVDADLRKDTSIDAELSGTTAVAVLYRKTPEGKHELFAANAGDSRAILGLVEGGKMIAQDLTIDQKPDTPAELKRIKKKGGFVSPPEEEWGGPARVWLDANMTLPGLAMARSIGDHLVTDIGVFAEPEITTKTFDFDGPKEKDVIYLVMASDGVWEFIESQDALDIADLLKLDSTAGCTRLIETAAAKWRHEEGDYRDDITAICIKIGKDFFETGKQ